MYNNNPNKYSQNSRNEGGVLMTKEEERIFIECCKDGFYKKIISYGSITTLCTYGALNYGLLKPIAKYGYTPAMIGAASIGSFVGLMSLRAACVQKVMDLPNSNLKRKVEALLNNSPYEASAKPVQTQPTIVSDLPNDDYQTPHDFDTYTGVNTDTDQHSDFYIMEPLDKYAGTATTYEELRQKNRDEYTRSRMAGIPSGNDFPRMAPETPHFKRNHVPFEQDKPPQYQLND